MLVMSIGSVLFLYVQVSAATTGDYTFSYSVADIQPVRVRGMLLG